MSDIYCRSYTAASLEEYLEIIRHLNGVMVKKGDKPQYSPIWYRGQERQSYVLLPTLQRGSTDIGPGYSHDHLREDMRYQHFRSKCNQLVNTSPESKIEWQEVL